MWDFGVVRPHKGGGDRRTTWNRTDVQVWTVKGAASCREVTGSDTTGRIRGTIEGNRYLVTSYTVSTNGRNQGVDSTGTRDGFFAATGGVRKAYDHTLARASRDQRRTFDVVPSLVSNVNISDWDFRGTLADAEVTQGQGATRGGGNRDREGYLLQSDGTSCISRHLELVQVHLLAVSDGHRAQSLTGDRWLALANDEGVTRQRCTHGRARSIHNVAGADTNGAYVHLVVVVAVPCIVTGSDTTCDTERELISGTSHTRRCTVHRGRS